MIYARAVHRWLHALWGRLNRFIEMSDAKQEIEVAARCDHVDFGACEQCQWEHAEGKLL